MDTKIHSEQSFDFRAFDGKNSKKPELKNSILSSQRVIVFKNRVSS